MRAVAAALIIVTTSAACTSLSPRRFFGPFELSLNHARVGEVFMFVPKFGPGVLLALLALSGQDAQAIASCSAQAVGPGDNCGLGKPFADSPEATLTNERVITTGASSVDLRSGALRGAVRISDGPELGGTGSANASFGSTLLVDFRIMGPVGPASVPVRLISTLSGNLAATCTWPDCEANLNYRIQLDSVTFSGFQMLSTTGTTLVQPWTTDSSTLDTSGRALAPVVTFQPRVDGASFVLGFDAAQALGQTLRARIELSANVHLFNAPDNTLISAEAGHTALFNVLTPSGFVVDAFGVELLTQPLLVPEPPVALLILLGLVSHGVRTAWRRDWRAVARQHVNSSV